MLGAFCAVTLQKLLTLSQRVKDESVTFFDAYKEVPYLEIWFGDVGKTLIDLSVPLAILLAIPVMLLIGRAMERRSEEHTSEPQSLMRSSYAVFCLKNKNTHAVHSTTPHSHEQT